MPGNRSRFSWLLICSLALNVALVGVAGTYILHKGGVGFLMRRTGLEKSDAHLLPFQSEAEKTQAALPINPQDTVFVGDSITAAAPYAEYFTRVKNRGVGGETTSQILARIDGIVAKKPAMLFVMAGTNDLCQDVALDEIMDNYGQIISRTHDLSPATVIRVLAVPPMNAEIRHAPYDPSPRIPELNRRIAAMCKERTIPFIDLYPALQDDAGQLKREYTVDGLHLSPAGYARLMPMLAAYDPGATPSSSAPRPSQHSSLVR